MWCRIAACWLVSSATACAFDSSTNGSGGAVGSTTDDASSSGAPATSTPGGPSSSDATAPPTTDDSNGPTPTTDPSATESDASSSTTSSEMDTETTVGEATDTTMDPCATPATFVELIWVQDLPANATTDMQLEESISLVLDGMPVIYARSLMADVGSVRFEFDIECAGEVYFWGLVFDWVPLQTAGPDSYWYGIDDDAMAGGDAWVYGCTTTMSTWSWQPVQHYNGSVCNTDPLVPTLDAGPHMFSLLNREPGTTGIEVYNFAGVAAIAITNDPDYDPNSDYTP